MANHRVCAAASLALGAILLGGCVTTSGLGSGDLTRARLGPEPLIISWTSQNGGISGKMVATLPNATYTGRFFEIKNGVERTALEPLWVGWPLGWSDWADPGSLPFADPGIDEFVTRYSGRVAANLKDAKDELMRCRFRVSAPQRGLSGGGEGECQIKGSQPIPVTF